jgi:hypothetical protein
LSIGVGLNRALEAALPRLKLGGFRHEEARGKKPVRLGAGTTVPSPYEGWGCVSSLGGEVRFAAAWPRSARDGPRPLQKIGALALLAGRPEGRPLHNGCEVLVHFAALDGGEHGDGGDYCEVAA